MKTKISIIILLIGSCLLACGKQKITTVKQNPEARIILKEFKVINGIRYSIIEVDSVEYLTQDIGGFVRLTK